jgi:diaminopimelate epimerase
VEVHFINTGVPHAVVFTENLDNVDVVKDGAALRYHPDFAPKGTNANFVQVLAPDSVAIRTYERGVEGETLACGTGVCAAALLQHLRAGSASPISVRVHGGDLLRVGSKDPATTSPCDPHGAGRFCFRRNNFAVIV